MEEAAVNGGNTNRRNAMEEVEAVIFTHSKIKFHSTTVHKGFVFISVSLHQFS